MHVDLYNINAETLIGHLDKRRVEKCWLLTWTEINPGPWQYIPLTVEKMWEAYSKYPSRIVPMYAPDPLDDKAITKLEYWHNKGIRGYGELKSTANWESVNVTCILSTIEKIRIPVIFHMEERKRCILPMSSSICDRALYRVMRSSRSSLKLPQGIINGIARLYSPLGEEFEYYDFPGYMQDFAQLERTLKRFRGISFVAHGPMFWKHYSDDALYREEADPGGPVTGEGIIWRLMKENANLYADLSRSGFLALKRNRVYAQRFLERYEDKILYGTDNSKEDHIDFLYSLGLSDRAYNKIFWANASNLITG